jgi:hypothetical protein
MLTIGSEARWHLPLAQRSIVQYNFYINDQRGSDVRTTARRGRPD